MSQWDQLDNHNGGKEQPASPDSWGSESSADIYDTPDVAMPAKEQPAEEIAVEDVSVENIPEEGREGGAPVPADSPYGGGTPYQNGPAVSEPQQGGGDPYGGGTPYGNSASYGGQPYPGGSPYGGGTPYQNGPAMSGPQQGGGDPYGGGTPYGNSASYSGQPYPNGGSYGGGYNGNAYNGQYSPYAVPPKKNKNGLVIGIVVTVIVLFLIAASALTYRLVRMIMQDGGRKYDDREEYNFDEDDGWGIHHDDSRGDTPDYDEDGDDGSREESGASDEGGYYELHDELRWDLSYVVDFEEYYEGDDGEDSSDSGRDIYITYPVIAGDDVPNLDSLNRTIMDEVDFLKDVADDAEEGVDVHLSGEAYVTYMDEERLSIVFEENLYLDYGGSEQVVDYYLYSLNIDMENGVVLDNGSMVNTDDDFSVDFRRRSDEQNGEISYLTALSDQEITEYFKSDDIIVFYTPLGMEIGFNYEYGWVTVTYRDYEQYLRVF